MPLALETEQVRGVLERLRALGEEQDGAYSARVLARESELGEKLYGLERAEIGARAPQAVAPEVGRILYGLIITARPGLTVEFALGSSTIHLAAALDDREYISEPDGGYLSVEIPVDAGLLISTRQ